MTTNKQIHVATSPLTNRIYAGTVLKDGRTWGANKSDVTGEACEHVLANGEPVIASVFTDDPRVAIDATIAAGKDALNA